ncbi:PP2C family protein-serine/threonine phosphatase [Synechococcus sp. EJ6-Ellesmere]|uniref:PP2C family protein-serine/threonine phosphatase n=1 Tax=Synechococcus sp. EJ6-Ellesmere TaxID=2823734 RepID=UPI0020CC879A|nr:PP2C family protein-serine/threonine phosphatase [Synechococcus sp. EJ6-Ellesmere]MCP9825338.1 serine/threonine-protein phosphatase [Synechococcus sp. EJ6-Ellesmere]
MAAYHPDVAMFATVFLGAFDYNSKSLYYISAGHESPLILRSKGITESLEVSGPAIGIFSGANYIVKCADLRPGEMLLTYTDGLIDTRNPSGESYGIERVKTMLALVDPAITTASELLESTIKQANHYRADADKFDDTTILVMKVNL